MTQDVVLYLKFLRISDENISAFAMKNDQSDVILTCRLSLSNINANLNVKDYIKNEVIPIYETEIYKKLLEIKKEEPKKSRLLISENRIPSPYNPNPYHQPFGMPFVPGFPNIQGSNMIGPTHPVFSNQIQPRSNSNPNSFLGNPSSRFPNGFL